MGNGEGRRGKRRVSVAVNLLLGGMLAVAALSPGEAAPPIPFDGWSSAGGAISSPCPPGYTCEVNVNDQGILQRLLTSPSGVRYIQLILDSATPQGRLREESFVRADNAPLSGIASKQVLDSTAAGNLTSAILINTGWAMDPGQAAVVVDQTLTDTTPEGAQFSQVFQKLIDQDANGIAIGYYTAIRQDVINSTLLTGGSLGPNDQDIHAFVLRQVQGTRNPTSGSATLPGGGMRGGGMGGGGMGGGMRGGGTFGGTVSWNVGDEVRVIWIGQICTGGCRQGGMMGGGMMGGGGGGMGGGGMGGMMGGGLFAYQAYDNLSDNAPEILTRSLFSTDPFTWQDPPFGPQPGL